MTKGEVELLETKDEVAKEISMEAYKEEKRKAKMYM